MPGSSVELSTKVINHLKSTYGIDDSNAYGIYNEAINLYHQLLTKIDLNPLRTIDKTKFKSLSFLRLLLSMIIYIITFCQNT
jgi:hypothetical protein